MADSEPTPFRILSDKPQIYEQIRDEQLRELTGQRAELDSMRSRTSQYLAFVGSGAGFLAGLGLTRIPVDQRDWLFHALAILGTASFAVLSYFGAMVLIGSGGAPRPQQFKFYVDASALLEKAEHGEKKQPSLVGFIRHLGLIYAANVRHNDPLIVAVRRSYVVALCAGGATIVFWGALLWAKG